MNSTTLSFVRTVANTLEFQVAELARTLDAIIDWDRIENPVDRARLHALVDEGTVIPNKIYFLDDHTAEIGCHFVQDYLDNLRLDALGHISWGDDCESTLNKDTHSFVRDLGPCQTPLLTFARVASALRSGDVSMSPEHYGVGVVTRDSASQWNHIRDRVSEGYFGRVWIPIRRAGGDLSSLNHHPAVPWYCRRETAILPRHLSILVQVARHALGLPSYLIQSLLRYWDETRDPAALLHSWYALVGQPRESDIIIEEAERDRYASSCLPEIISAICVTLGLRGDEVNELLG